MKIGQWGLTVPKKYDWQPQVGRIVRVTACYVWFEKRQDRHHIVDIVAAFETEQEALDAKARRDELLKPFDEERKVLELRMRDLTRTRCDVLDGFHKTVSPT